MNIRPENRPPFAQQPAHVIIDHSQARRVFTFGDIHGNIAPLKEAMLQVGYDASKGDRMIGLGDWLDRGNDTTLIADFIEEHATDLAFVKGNHEQMLEDAVRPREGGIPSFNLIANGGQWVLGHINEDIEDEDFDEDQEITFDEDFFRIVKAVCGAPIAITVKTPGGKDIGFIHAEVRRMFGQLDWKSFTEVLEEQGPDGFIAKDAMWERDEVYRIAHANAAKEEVPRSDYVQNIDHVFIGHTILRRQLNWGNQSWIDIGSYKRGYLDLIDVDAWSQEQYNNPSQRG